MSTSSVLKLKVLTTIFLGGATLTLVVTDRLPGFTESVPIKACGCSSHLAETTKMAAAMGRHQFTTYRQGVVVVLCFGHERRDGVGHFQM